MTACWCACRPRSRPWPSFHEAARIGCGLLNVVEVIGQAVLAHIGCASASTLARNFGGRSPGVSRSTSTPSSDFSSSSKSPKSNNVAPGSASTNRSRSLPSRSVPCSTEPKTRGFAARKRPTASHCASLHVKHNRRSHAHPFLSKLVEMICNQE